MQSTNTTARAGLPGKRYGDRIATPYPPKPAGGAR